MIHSMKYDYYKFPGGGIEPGEDPAEAMIRETREETGLVVIPETIREYGLVHRIQRSDSDPTEVFIQDNYYYLCDAEETMVSQHLDGYESKEDYQLAFVDPYAAIEKNSGDIHGPYNPMMFQREAKVLNMLIDEGYLK
jgi:8-oxo-dGTP pyrophosphatase MutT (NUDIX family)